MAPQYLFFVLVVLAAVAMLRLSDGNLVRVVGVSTLLQLMPAGLLLGPYSWREHLASEEPSTLAYVLVGMATIGVIFLAAAALAACLRVALQVFRALRAKMLKNKLQNA